MVDEVTLHKISTSPGRRGTTKNTKKMMSLSVKSVHPPDVAGLQKTQRK
jgi:hypothetical protein